jgi:hypothetical protein
MNDAQPYEKSMIPLLEDIPALLTRETWLSTSIKDLDLDSLSKTTLKVVQNAKKANQ